MPTRWSGSTHSGKITARLRPGFAPTRLALGFGSLWVAASGNGGADVLVRYRLDGHERSRRMIAHGIVDVTAGQGYVWVAERSFPNVSRLDPDGEKLAVVGDACGRDQRALGQR